MSHVTTSQPTVVSPSLRQVLQSIAAGTGTSRAAIARLTGLARSAVGQHVENLLRRGIVDEVENSQSVRGRPPRTLQISRQTGAIAVIDIDTGLTRVAIADLTGRILAKDVISRPCSDGPDGLLSDAAHRIQHLLTQHGHGSAVVRQVVAGLPAPVDFHHGRAVRPPIMPGWDGYPVADHLGEAMGCPAVVDNDVNLIALGEASQDHLETPLIAIKIATGIGAGLVNADGQVHRGADGAAGDIGHIRLAGHDDVICQCGNTGCLESVASYSAVLRELHIWDAPAGVEHGPDALLARLTTGDPRATRAVRSAAMEIGQVAAMLVHAYNPRTLVLTGPLTEIRDEVLAGVRAVVYERALPLATRKLTITTSQLGTDAGILGGISLALVDIFSYAGIDRLLNT